MRDLCRVRQFQSGYGRDSILLSSLSIVVEIREKKDREKKDREKKLTGR